jgi:hypothetical protein
MDGSGEHSALKSQLHVQSLPWQILGHTLLGILAMDVTLEDYTLGRTYFGGQSQSSDVTKGMLKCCCDLEGNDPQASTTNAPYCTHIDT